MGIVLTESAHVFNELPRLLDSFKVAKQLRGASRQAHAFSEKQEDPVQQVGLLVLPDIRHVARRRRLHLAVFSKCLVSAQTHSKHSIHKSRLGNTRAGRPVFPLFAF